MLWNVLSLFVYFVSQRLHPSIHPSLHLVEIFLNFLFLVMWCCTCTHGWCIICAHAPTNGVQQLSTGGPQPSRKTFNNEVLFALQLMHTKQKINNQFFKLGVFWDKKQLEISASYWWYFSLQVGVCPIKIGVVLTKLHCKTRFRIRFLKSRLLAFLQLHELVSWWLYYNNL